MRGGASSSGCLAVRRHGRSQRARSRTAPPPRRGLDRWKRQRSHKPTTRYDLSRCHARARLVEGRNVKIDVRFPATNAAEETRAAAAELAALNPDVIVTTGAPIWGRCIA